MIESLEVFILSGGKSSRMGQDKGLMEVDGLPMISYTLATLQRLNLHPTIIANEPEYRKLGFSILQDEVKDCGPMGGLYTALTHSQEDQVLLLSCDTPNVKEKTLAYLIEESQPDRINVCRHKGKIHPLIGIYPKSLLSRVANNIENGMLKMQHFIQESPHHFIETESIASDREFYNINTKEDLRVMYLEQKKIKVLAFGVIAEKMGQAEIEIDHVENVSQLKEMLINNYPQLASLKFSIAVNKQLVSADKTIDQSDEIALLPPFSGG